MIIVLKPPIASTFVKRSIESLLLFYICISYWLPSPASHFIITSSLAYHRYDWMINKQKGINMQYVSMSIPFNVVETCSLAFPS